MAVNYLHPSATGHGTAGTAPRPGPAGPQRPGTAHIDWRAARRAGQACCCPAKPAVIAAMPPATGRPHTTELLLCGHHYRASRRALAAAGATVWDINGVPVNDDAWETVSAAQS